jgi:hypothetical protein
VGQIGIHLRDISVWTVAQITEPGHVSASQPLLVPPVQNEESIRVLLLELVRYFSRAVGRIIIDDQNMNVRYLCPKRLNDRGKILAFVDALCLVYDVKPHDVCRN